MPQPMDARLRHFACHAAKCVRMSEAKATSRIAGDETVFVLWELLKGLWLRDKCRCEGTYCYCFLI